MTRNSSVFNVWRSGAVVAVGVLIGGFALDTGAYAQSSADVNARLRRLERDIRDLQSETFKKGPEGAQASTVPLPPEPPPSAEPAQQMPDLGPMMRRLDELESSVTRLTGQMEEIGHRIDQLATQAERMQKQMEFDATQRANAQAAAPPPTGDQLASAAPPPGAPALPGAPPQAPTTPGVLGQIPAGSTLPTPAPAPDPKREFDTAMTLLSRAQYDDASQAFRKFTEEHPEDERASAALYWTGDIAYSAKKDYQTAARDFAELLKRYPAAPRAPDSMLKLGLSLFELGQKNEGCAALAALPAKYPQASPAIATRARNERRDAMCR